MRSHSLICKPTYHRTENTSLPGFNPTFTMYADNKRANDVAGARGHPHTPLCSCNTWSCLSWPSDLRSSGARPHCSLPFEPALPESRIYYGYPTVALRRHDSTVLSVLYALPGAGCSAYLTVPSHAPLFDNP